MSEDIKALNEKLDFLTSEVTGITSRLKAFDELKEDLALFANDAFSEVIHFLSDVDFHFRSEEFVLLVKKLLRNVGNMSKLMTQLESITELMEDVSPLAKEIFHDLVERFAQFEKDNLFKGLESVMKTIQTLYRDFSPREIENMSDNYARLIKIFNRLVTSENLDKLEMVARELENMDNRKREKISLFKIMKKARNPEVLHSLDMVLDIAAKLSKPKSNSECHDPGKAGSL